MKKMNPNTSLESDFLYLISHSSLNSNIDKS